MIKVIKVYKQLVLGENCDPDAKITLQNRIDYVTSKLEPATSQNTRKIILEKCGTSIEMEVFSLLTKKYLDFATCYLE